MAWQFDRPEAGRGVIQAFRRPGSLYTAARFQLRGIDAAATYVLTNLDGGDAKEASGSELMDPGLLVDIQDQPGAAVITYKKRAPFGGA